MSDDVKWGPVVELPDGSGFCTACFPLPKEHWLTVDGREESPMIMRMGTDNPKYRRTVSLLRKAAQYAIRTSTGNGSIEDFDPDAMVQNFLIACVGYHTPTGYPTHDHDHDSGEQEQESPPIIKLVFDNDTFDFLRDIVDDINMSIFSEDDTFILNLEGRDYGMCSKVFFLGQEVYCTEEYGDLTTKEEIKEAILENVGDILTVVKAVHI